MEEAHAHWYEVGRVEDEAGRGREAFFHAGAIRFVAFLDFIKAFLSERRFWHFVSVPPHLIEVFVARIERIEVGRDQEVRRCLEQDDVCRNDTAHFGVEVDDITYDQVLGIDEVLLPVAQDMRHGNRDERESVVQVDLAGGRDAGPRRWGLQALVLHRLEALLLAVLCVATTEYFHEELAHVTDHIAHLVLAVELLLIGHILGGDSHPQQVVRPVPIPRAQFIKPDNVLIPRPNLNQLFRCQLRRLLSHCLAHTMLFAKYDLIDLLFNKSAFTALH